MKKIITALTLLVASSSVFAAGSGYAAFAATDSSSVVGLNGTGSVTATNDYTASSTVGKVTEGGYHNGSTTYSSVQNVTQTTAIQVSGSHHHPVDGGALFSNSSITAGYAGNVGLGGN